MKENPLEDKSFDFAIRVVRMYQHLSKTKKELVLSRQLLRSGTSIGANVQEANCGQTKRDFIHKLSIAQKETRETMFWIRLLYRTDYLTQTEFDSIFKDVEEIYKIVTSSLLTAKGKNK
jgi:four helix bundle protein